MPEQAKVFVAEDEERYLEWHKRFLTEHGHTVVLEAQTRGKALENVKLAKEKGVNVAVLDGSLSTFVVSKDGAIIAEALREKVPGIKIVSCSGSPQDWGDVNLRKSDILKIGEVVTNL